MNNNFSKDVSQETLKKIYTCVIVAIGIMAYFIVLNLAYNTMKLERLVGDIEVFSGAFLVVGIYLLEKAYKEDSGTLAVSAIESFVLSIHSLTIMHVITILEFDFRLYLLTSSYVFAIYYIMKSIFIYTKGRRDYAKTFSDISEIVKKDEPKKKEATKKRKPQEQENNEEDLKGVEVSKKTKIEEDKAKDKTAGSKTKKEDKKSKNKKSIKTEVKKQEDVTKNTNTKKTMKEKNVKNVEKTKGKVENEEKLKNKGKSKKTKKEE